MQNAELIPGSSNWNQIKSEFGRNVTVFEQIKSNADDKTNAELKKLIKLCHDSEKIMTELEGNLKGFNPTQED